MARPRTGNLEVSGKRRYARVLVAKGTYKRVPIPPQLTDEEARVFVAQVASVAEEVSGPSLDKWAKTWFADRRRRGLTSVRDDEGRWKTWFSELHHIHPKALTTEDVEAAVHRLDVAVSDGRISWKTATNAWHTLSRMCRDMARSKDPTIRVRKDNPAQGVEGPDRGVTKAKVYLYPREAERLLACERVPVRWRVAYALAIYTYTRKGELDALTWGDVDLDAGLVRVTKARERDGEGTKAPKGKKARVVPVEPSLLPLLRAIKGDRDEPVFRVPRHAPERLRSHLEWSGARRPSLFETTKTTKQITFHDLRATGATWAAVRGDDPRRIQRRCGHKEFSTTEAYLREADEIGHVGEPFPPIPASLVESARETARGRFKGHGKAKNKWFPERGTGFEAESQERSAAKNTSDGDKAWQIESDAERGGAQRSGRFGPGLARCNARRVPASLEAELALYDWADRARLAGGDDE